MGKYAIQKKKLYEEVMDQISNVIRSGDYKVGDRLPSLQEFSDMFEVGKPTLREALSVLAATGILEIRHGSGIFVKKLFDDQLYNVAAQLGRVEAEKLLHWLEFRRAIEVEATGLASKRRTDYDIKMIEEAQENLEADIEQGNIGAHWDYEFHLRISIATHNPIFSQAVTTTEEILKHFFELSIRQSLAIPSRREVVTHEHREILEKIKRGESHDAQRAMLKHIENVEKKVKLLSNI